MPVPIVVEPSGEFLGNDGAWSPFLVKVGTPPTPLRLLASTEIPETWVVVTEGCQNAASNCSDVRGGLFDRDGSKTWSFKSGDYNHSIFKISTEANLQIDVNALYGFDTVQIGSPEKGNATVDHQVVAGIADPAFYLGSLGLHNRKILFNGDQQGQLSFISTLNLNKQIPSLSYGFTAGASYRQANASLTLGGYDAARFTPNDVGFEFAPNQFRQKLVGLQSIWYTEPNSNGTLLPLPKGPIMTLVDSTVPHIWLPPETCKAFEQAFGLTYNPIANLYLINDTIHDALRKQNPSFIFQLSNNAGPGPAINITLPYASFDLEVQAGYNTAVSKNSRYFPLRQALQGTPQYTLGRTFFQESYLIVNYEYGNFSISQLKVSDDPPHIVPIAAAATPTSIGSPSSLPSTITKSTSLPSTPSGSSGGSKSLATPAIAGIAVAIVVTVIFAAFGIWFCRRRRQRKRPMKETPELPAYPIHPHSAAELNGNQGNEKTPGLIVTDASDEKIQFDFDKNQTLMRQAGHDPSRGIDPAELAGGPGFDLLHPELPSPDPSNRHELSSSEAEVIRSELSTPEPNWPAEMPSPEIGASELGGSTVRGGSSEGRPDSPAFSLWPPDRAQTPSHRTGAGHGSIDSNASDDNNGNNTSWAAIPGTIIPSSSHSRMPSSNYSTASNSRPPHTRLDSTSSTISSSSLLPRGVGPAYTNYSTRPLHSRMDSNTSDTPSLPTPSTISRRHSMPYPTSYSFPRPPHRRLDSKDSSETFETRLELSPPVSPFLPPPSAAAAAGSSSPPHANNTNNNNGSPSNRGAVVVEALPSTWIPVDGDGTAPSFIIQPHHHHYNSRNSIRSALRSPEPFNSGFGVEEEDEDYEDDDNDGGVEEGREKEGQEEEVVPRSEEILSEEPEEIIIGEQQQQHGGTVHPVREEEVSEATKLMAEGGGK